MKPTILMIIASLPITGLFGQDLTAKPSNAKVDSIIKRLNTPSVEYIIVQRIDGKIDTVLNFKTTVPKDSLGTTSYTWKRKTISYKDYRDSLKFEYRRFTDSLERARKNIRKEKER